MVKNETLVTTAKWAGEKNTIQITDNLLFGTVAPLKVWNKENMIRTKELANKSKKVNGAETQIGESMK